ncbi:MAG: aromatic-ring-hydroxylating dioxygenase subunit beta [Alphaproteobacteria bacterium]
MSDPALRAEIENFLYREARLLDERRFEDWRELFADDGVYWVPVRPEQTDPLHEVSIFYDDRTAMAARIRRLRHPRAHAELPPTRAIRAVSNIEIASESGTEIGARSVLTMTEFRDQIVTVYMARVRWILAHDGGYRIRLKRVDLVNADGMHHLITVPF